MTAAPAMLSSVSSACLEHTYERLLLLLQEPHVATPWRRPIDGRFLERMLCTHEILYSVVHAGRA